MLHDHSSEGKKALNEVISPSLSKKEERRKPTIVPLKDGRNYKRNTKYDTTSNVPLAGFKIRNDKQHAGSRADALAN
uniref:Uncharacterized protein n=1 Tax=Pristionchus pacificus TaxID=54126 RepID=A0A2A6BTQ6_PRIPA|eukprot:PDM69237.1 hypothetical protein PRIPAC_47539 [Pristionchus pacificus]